MRSRQVLRVRLVESLFEQKGLTPTVLQNINVLNQTYKLA